MLKKNPPSADRDRTSLRPLRSERWVAALLLYTGIVLIVYSRIKLPWGDEVLTYYSIHGRTLAGLLHFQSTTPISLEPPVNELVTWLSTRLFGYSIWVLRLPSMLFFLFLEWLVYRLGELAGDVPSGILAAAIFAGSLVLDYGAEARPYAMLTAFTALSLVLWALARRSKPVPVGPLVLLAVTIAAAVLTQFYGAMAVLPVAVAELTLSLRQRRAPNRGVCLAVAAGLAAIGLLLPFLRAAHLYQSHLAVQGSFGIVEFFETYDWGFISRPAVFQWHGHPFWFWSAPLLVFAVAGSFPRSDQRVGAALAPELRSALWAGLVALMLYPVPALLLGRYAVHSYAPRYAIQYIVGFVVLLGVAGARLLKPFNRRLMIAITAAGAIVLVLRDAEIVGHRYKMSKAILAAYTTSDPVRQFLARNADKPIYLTIDECLVYPFYGDQAYTGRVRCIYSVPLEEQYSHTLMASTTTLILANHTDFPLRVSSYEEMRANAPVMLAYYPLPWLTWIPSAVAADHATTADVGTGFGGEVMKLTYPQK